MIRCVYTTDKHKKLKKWMDGYVKIKGSKFVLHDIEKTNIYSTKSIPLDNEMDVGKYLILIDTLDDSSEDHDVSPPDATTTEDNPKRSKIISTPPRTSADTSVSKGRSEEEIIDLFRL